MWKKAYNNFLQTLYGNKVLFKIDNNSKARGENNSGNYISTKRWQSFNYNCCIPRLKNSKARASFKGHEEIYYKFKISILWEWV